MTNYLSHSQIETFSQCRRRWYLTKIEKAPQAPSEALILGDAVHQALEADGREIKEHGAKLDLMPLRGIFEQALNDRIGQDDPRELLDWDRCLDMLAKGHTILSAYVEHVQPSYVPTAVEEKIGGDEGIPIPGTDDWHFTGRIDARVNLYGDENAHAILDFKTGKAWSVGAEHMKDQATAYLWADCEIEDKPIAWYVVFCLFPTESDGNGGYVCTPQFRITERTMAQIDAYEDGLRATVRAITEAKRNNDFPARTGPLCGWCGVLGSCKAGQDWLRMKGRKPAVPMVRRPLDEHEEEREES